MRYRILRTSLDAIATKNAPAIVDVVNLSIPFINADAFLRRSGIVTGNDVNAFRWAGSSTKVTGNAFLFAVFVNMQQMLATITRLHRDRLVGIFDGPLS